MKQNNITVAMTVREDESEYEDAVLTIKRSQEFLDIDEENLDVLKPFFDNESDRIVEFLADNLPGGTFSRVAVSMYSALQKRSALENILGYLSEDDEDDE